MADCAWNSLVSANKKAELKFRNVNPTLKYCLGCEYPATKRDLYPRRPKPATLLDIITEPHKGFEFLSIPDLTFLHQSDHIVTSEFASVNYPYGRVTVFDVKGDVITTFPPKDTRKDIHLFGITSLPNDDVAICTGDGVSIWNLDGRMVSHMTQPTVENCCHVTLMQNHLLATTCITKEDGKCVTMWDPKCGKVTSQFGSRPEVIELNPLKQKQKILIRNRDIRLPWFIASDSSLNVFISDRTAQCVKVYDSTSGKYLRRFDAAGVDTRCAKGSLMPQGICVDDDDNIFVADEVSSSVLIFDKHGEKVRYLPLKIDPKEDQVWALALNNNHELTCGKRNPAISPTRKMALSFSHRKPRGHVYNLSFCDHYSIRF
ncbi:uncharacterized protein LOC143451727 [Clavelina lepadiformis]|uniref:uncharacterized protein LOC143451727 n=1 Tax=Clavelina lepadiformis TaxID=159417 RepID=UPI004041B2FC